MRKPAQAFPDYLAQSDVIGFIILKDNQIIFEKWTRRPMYIA